MQERRIYLDLNAATPVAPEVAAAITEALTEQFGNPSSDYWEGLLARPAVEKARAQVAALLGCSLDEVVFARGGTESKTITRCKVCSSLWADGHIITTQVAHPAVLNPCHFLERLGASVTYLPVDRFGQVGPDDVPRPDAPHHAYFVDARQQ